MAIDVPLFVSVVYIYFMMNFYGWGLLQTKLFATFCLFVVLLYLLSGLFGFFGKSYLMLKTKMGLAFVFLIVSVFITTVNFINLRHITHVTGFISDSAVQVEIAGRYLLLGKNPYTENYFNTDFENVPYTDEADNKLNPALYHYAYPPMLTVMSAIGHIVFPRTIGFFDIRIFYLFFYFLFILLGIVKFGIKENMLLFLILVCLNPIFTILLTQGANDVVVITFLLWSLFLLEKKMIVQSAILLGFAIATKQTAWFAIPFFFFYGWKLREGKNFITYCIVTFFVSLVFYLPFIIWDVQSMLDDLVFYMSGSTVNSYPIKNFGFGMFLYSVGFIKSVYDYYPFWIWQAIFGLLMVFTFFYSQRKYTTSQNILYGYTIFISLIWFFNRFLNYNYLAYILVLVGITYVWVNNSTQKSKKLFRNKQRI